MAFSDWLRERLKESPDLNQARLAEALGVYASTVHFWVKGRSLPDLDKVPRLAELLGVEPFTIYRMLGVSEDAQTPNLNANIASIAYEIQAALDTIQDPAVREYMENKLIDSTRKWRDDIEELIDLVETLRARSTKN